jgi:peptide/nickel transport system substrate-binding protein
MTEPIHEDGPSGPPAIKTIVVNIVEDFNTRLAMLQAGDADDITISSQEYFSIMDQLVGEHCVGNNKPENCETLEGDASSLPLRRIIGLPNTGRFDIFFNWKVSIDEGNPYIGSGKLDGNGIPSDFFSDVHIRKAMNYCFDFDAYLMEVMQGEGERSLGVMLPGMLGYPENERFTYTYDLEKCAQEFKESNWVNDDRTHLWDLGFRMSSVYYAGSQQLLSISQILQAGVAAVNEKFIIEATGLPWPAFLAAYRSNHLPIFLVGWGSDYYDTHNWAPIFTNALLGFRQGLPQDLMDLYTDINNRAAVASPEERQRIYMDEFNPAYFENAHGITLFIHYLRLYEPRYMVGGSFNPMAGLSNYYYLSKK